MERTCKVCFEDLTNDINVMYKLSITDEFKDFDYCSICLDELINSQWNKFVNELKKVDCEEVLNRLIILGPPINFRDHSIEDNKEIHEFYFNNQIHSAKLKNSFNKENNEKLWKRLIDVGNFLKCKDVDIDKIDYINELQKVLIEFNL